MDPNVTDQDQKNLGKFVPPTDWFFYYVFFFLAGETESEREETREADELGIF